MLTLKKFWLAKKPTNAIHIELTADGNKTQVARELDEAIHRTANGSIGCIEM